MLRFKAFIAASVVAGGMAVAEETKLQPISIRNNNPGNIKLSGDIWDGSVKGGEGGFVKFESPEMGARAMAKLLGNYQTKHGLNTVGSMINRWAPPSENDTATYASTVASRMGVGVDDVIDFSKNRGHLKSMMRHMIDYEGGNPAKTYYTDKIINSGVNLAAPVTIPRTRPTAPTTKPQV